MCLCFFYFAFLGLCSFLNCMMCLGTYYEVTHVLQFFSCCAFCSLAIFLGRVTGSGYCSVLHLSAHAVIFKFTCLKHSA